VRHSQADITKARTLLGYEPRYDVEQGLEESADWYVRSLAQPEVAVR
jgi:UDP-N-acetylglucosamine 4-epimerase